MNRRSFIGAMSGVLAVLGIGRSKPPRNGIVECWTKSGPPREFIVWADSCVAASTHPGVPRLRSQLRQNPKMRVVGIEIAPIDGDRMYLVKVEYRDGSPPA